MDMSKVPVPKGWADLPNDPTEGPHCWGWGWWLAFLTEDKDLASHPERVPTSNLDEGCLRARLWFLHVHVLAPVTNYTMHLNGSRLVMMAFTLLRKGKKNGVRDGPFYGVAGTVPMEGGKSGLMLWRIELFELFTLTASLLAGCLKISPSECSHDNSPSPVY